MKNSALIFLSAFLVNNIILIRLIGICPCFCLPSTLKRAAGMGMAIILVMTIATWITWIINHAILLPLDLVFLRTATFILLVVLLVQFGKMLLSKYYRVSSTSLNIYRPLITTNCVILAVTFLNIDNNYNLLQGTAFALGSGLGFALVIIIFAALGERLNQAPINPSLKGYPIAFVAASLVSLAFLGFLGLFGLT